MSAAIAGDSVFPRISQAAGLRESDRRMQLQPPFGGRVNHPVKIQNVPPKRGRNGHRRIGQVGCLQTDFVFAGRTFFVGIEKFETRVFSEIARRPSNACRMSPLTFPQDLREQPEISGGAVVETCTVRAGVHEKIDIALNSETRNRHADSDVWGSRE